MKNLFFIRLNDGGVPTARRDISQFIVCYAGVAASPHDFGMDGFVRCCLCGECGLPAFNIFEIISHNNLVGNPITL